MEFKCELTQPFIKSTVKFSEFGNGGAQATIRLKNGKIYEEALISGSRAIVAIRGYDEPPFSPNEIEEIYQKENDINPENCSGWKYWDKW